MLINKLQILLLLFLFLVYGCDSRLSKSREDNKDSTIKIGRETQESKVDSKGASGSVYGNETSYKVIDTGYWIPAEERSVFWKDNSVVYFRSSANGKYDMGNFNGIKVLDLGLRYYDLERSIFGSIEVDYNFGSEDIRLDCLSGTRVIIRHNSQRYTGDLSNEIDQKKIENVEPVPEEYRWPSVNSDCLLIEKNGNERFEYTTRLLPKIDAKILGQIFRGDIVLEFQGGAIEEKINIDITDVSHLDYVESVGMYSFVSLQPETAGAEKGEKEEQERYFYLVQKNGQIERKVLPEQWWGKGKSILDAYWVKGGFIASSVDFRVESRTGKDQGLFFFGEKFIQIIIKGWIKDVSVSPNGCRVAINHVDDLRLDGNVEGNRRTLKIVELCN